MTQNSTLLPNDNWIRLAWGFVLLGLLGGLALAGLSYVFGYGGWWSPAMGCAALGWLGVAAWGPQAIAWRGQARLIRLQHALENLASTDQDNDTQAQAHQIRTRLTKAENRKRRSHWWQMALVFLGSGGAIAFWLIAWPQAQDGAGLIWFILVALLAFPMLILGNALAQNSNPALSHQAGFVRFTTLSMLALGMITAMRGAMLPVDIIAGDAPLSIWALRLLAIVHIALAVEWILRAAISPFLPIRSASRLTSSVVLKMVTGHQLGGGDGLEDQLGIDISQSWAVQFIRRTSPWMVMGMAFATWAMSAVTALKVDERGLYQRMGHVTPEVLEPGLHLHLPWPLGSVRRISYGAIREVRLNTDDTVKAPEIRPSTTGVEDPTNKFDDRIWSKIHGQELFLMIANQPRLNIGQDERLDSQRPYELYHADVVVTYRVGLAAQDSRRATYHLSDPDSLIARIGRRELIDLFNSRTAEDLLFADFSALSQDAHRSLQMRLDSLSSGIDIVDVIFEAVHPPVNTAETFHRVHGAEKESDVLLDIARAEAEQIRATAQIAAAQINNEASADAVTRTAQARAERETFAAERRAYQNYREAFLFERRLQTLESSLADKNLILVDPEIRAGNGLVLDLRDTAPAQPAGLQKPAAN